MLAELTQSIVHWPTGASVKAQVSTRQLHEPFGLKHSDSGNREQLLKARLVHVLDATTGQIIASSNEAIINSSYRYCLEHTKIGLISGFRIIVVCLATTCMLWVGTQVSFLCRYRLLHQKAWRTLHRIRNLNQLHMFLSRGLTSFEESQRDPCSFRAFGGGS